jgi:hypothetical protein
MTDTSPVNALIKATRKAETRKADFLLQKSFMAQGSPQMTLRALMKINRSTGNLMRCYGHP